MPLYSEEMTLAEISRRHADARGAAVALSCDGRSMTFAELDKQANHVAQGLIAAGIVPGERVAILAKNGVDFFPLLLGAVKARACLAPLNWRLAQLELEFVLQDAQAHILFHSAEYRDSAKALATASKGRVRTIELESELPAWLAAQSGIDPHLPASRDEDVLQLYTSGTTGHPKGARLTHRTQLTMIESAVAAEWGKWEAGKTALITVPLFHVAGANMGLIALAQGARSVIMREMDAMRLARLLAEERIAYAFIVPTMINMVLQCPESAGADFSHVEKICYGASPISDDVLQRAIARFGCDFTQLYGLTETNGGATALAMCDHQGERLRSCGKAAPFFDVRVLTEEGADAKPGEIGEVAIRSPAVMRAYWNRPDANPIDSAGWFRTGDAGYLDADGYLFICDRVKDMIVSGGENVYPAEVENAIFGHPDVADAAIIGVPDEKWGEAVKAIVVLKPGVAGDPASIIAWARERIAAYKAPKSVDFIETLPRNPSGKVLRRELREKYWAGHVRRVG